MWVGGFQDRGEAGRCIERSREVSGHFWGGGEAAPPPSLHSAKVGEVCTHGEEYKAIGAQSKWGFGVLGEKGNLQRSKT